MVPTDKKDWVPPTGRGRGDCDKTNMTKKTREDEPKDHRQVTPNNVIFPVSISVSNINFYFLYFQSSTPGLPPSLLSLHACLHGLCHTWGIWAHPASPTIPHQKLKDFISLKLDSKLVYYNQLHILVAICLFVCLFKWSFHTETSDSNKMLKPGLKSYYTCKYAGLVVYGKVETD